MSAAVKAPDSHSKQRGRPRSTVRHQAILESTRALLAAGSYEQLTIEAIAAEAGVSKQTVYKWWPSKAAVVTEAVMVGNLALASVPPGDSGDLMADLRTWMRTKFDELAEPTVVALIRAMTAASAEGVPDDRFYELLAEPHRQYLLRRLSAASEQGQIRADADLHAAVDAIMGSLLMRALKPPHMSPSGSAEGLVDLLLDGVLRTPKTARATRTPARVRS